PLRKPIHLSTTGPSSGRSPPRLKARSARWLKIHSARTHRYTAGVGNILELLNAQKSLSEAKQQRIQALTDWRAARLQLAAKMGRLDAGDLRTEQVPQQ
ncbi:TolC family protein, partial [Paraburkholderia aspalathi]|nr:TolC family protein [Paraburkholderia aspalathi]